MLLEGKKVFVGPFLKRTDRPNDKETNYTNVFVKNLSEEVGDDELDKMFSEFGKVGHKSYYLFGEQYFANPISTVDVLQPIIM